MTNNKVTKMQIIFMSYPKKLCKNISIRKKNIDTHEMYKSILFSLVKNNKQPMIKQKLGIK